MDLHIDWPGEFVAEQLETMGESEETVKGTEPVEFMMTYSTPLRATLMVGGHLISR